MAVTEGKTTSGKPLAECAMAEGMEGEGMAVVTIYVGKKNLPQAKSVQLYRR